MNNMESFGLVFRVVTLVVTNLILNIVLFDFFVSRYGKKFPTIKKGLSIVCMVGVSILINILSNPIYNLILYGSLFLILNSFIFRCKERKDIVINITFFILLIIIEFIIYIFIVCMESVFHVAKDNLFVEDIKLLMSSLVQFVIYIICKDAILHTKISHLRRKDMIIYFILSISSTFVMAVAVLFIDGVKSEIQLYFLILVISVALLNIYFVYMIISLSQKYEIQKKLDILEMNNMMILNHYHLIEDRMKESNVVIHDIKNHLQTLKTSIYSDENTTSQEYFSVIENKIGELGTITFSDRKILNVVLSEKMREAQKRELKLEYRIDKSIAFSAMNDYDLVSVFANLLDNAIEATSEVDDDEKIIKLHIHIVNNFVLVKQINPCKNRLIEKNGKIISSKKGHEGLGLYSIQKTIEKYGANMLVELSDAKIFTSTVLFPYEVAK